MDKLDDKKLLGFDMKETLKYDDKLINKMIKAGETLSLETAQQNRGYKLQSLGLTLPLKYRIVFWSSIMILTLGFGLFIYMPFERKKKELTGRSFLDNERQKGFLK
eukprot:TRINITY_DN626_c1_g1_i1.p1 TRINITY_DN626_c1_g1~~TRINITY_DN626_c1_g1_i1.p1  ORF type:complete len:106 (-),score=26.48 TRINITY_DN626_c1_g1_i1:169-486(-)